MPRMQRQVAAKAKRDQREELAGPHARPRTASGPARGSRADALKIIFESAIELGEGFRHGVLGAPRMGKTFHVQDLVGKTIERGIAAWAFVHDCKKSEPQYEGAVRSSVADLMGKPLAPGESPIVVFHPRPPDRVEVDEVSSLALQFGRAGHSVLEVVDELYHALKSRMSWSGAATGQVFREGSSQRVSIAWTTQIPQSLPTEALDLSETVALFQLSGRSARYAVDAFGLPAGAAELLGRLGRGEFILAHSNREWDGLIYGPT